VIEQLNSINTHQQMRLWKKSRRWFASSTLCYLYVHGSTDIFGLGLLIVDVPKSHSDAPQSVGVFRTTYRAVAENPAWKHTTPPRDRHPCHPLSYTLRWSVFVGDKKVQSDTCNSFISVYY
jgi:hypothetical protein